VIASLAVQTHLVIIFSRSRRSRMQLDAVGYCASLALMPMRCLIYWSPRSAWFSLLEELVHITMDMIASQVRRHSLTVRRFITPETFAGVTLTMSLEEAAIVTTAISATEYGHREAEVHSVPEHLLLCRQGAPATKKRLAAWLEQPSLSQTCSTLLSARLDIACSNTDKTLKC
jgi:hypothetical protein